MVVVDTNVVAALVLAGDLTDAARALVLRDPEWAAPLQWRNEFRNVLTRHVRRGSLSVIDAGDMFAMAQQLMAGREYDVKSLDVIALAQASGRSAYDCEFVAVAKSLGVPLVTSDQALLKSFPDTAVGLSTFADSGR